MQTSGIGVSVLPPRMGQGEFEIYWPFEVLRRVGMVAYKLTFSASLSAVLVFHVPMLKKYVLDRSHKL